MAQSKELYDAIVSGDANKAHAATQAALEAGAEPMALISESMVPAMNKVGRLFECKEYFVPELLLAGRAMKNAMTARHWGGSGRMRGWRLKTSCSTGTCRRSRFTQTAPSR